MRYICLKFFSCFIPVFIGNYDNCDDDIDGCCLVFWSVTWCEVLVWSLELIGVNWWSEWICVSRNPNVDSLVCLKWRWSGCYNLFLYIGCGNKNPIGENTCLGFEFCFALDDDWWRRMPSLLQSWAAPGGYGSSMPTTLWNMWCGQIHFVEWRDSMSFPSL